MSGVENFIRKIVGPTDEEFDRIARITRLATYNGECGRGIVHTAEWVAFMTEVQAWFNEEQNTDTKPRE